MSATLPNQGTRLDGPRHFVPLPEAEVIPTKYFALTDRALRDSRRHSGLCVIHGPAGLGKTFAVEEALRAVDDMPVYWVDFISPRPSVKSMAHDLLYAITEVDYDVERRKATRLLVDELNREECVLVVDEAQDLTREGCEYLRRLHDHRLTRFALVLVGGHDCWRKLSERRHLKSRVLRRVAFERLSEDDLLEIIPRYHPLYQDVPKDLLLGIDEDFAHGSFREWAKFTADAADMCAAHGLTSLTEEVVGSVFVNYAENRA